MAEVFENRVFMNDLAVSARAVRSIVYCNGVATLAVYERTKRGMVTERAIHYPAERVPVAYLNDKFRRVKE